MKIDTLPKQVKKDFILHMGMLSKITEANASNEGVNTILDKTGEDLALYFANFKCEKCSTTINLTIHHLINRYVKRFVNIVKYRKQRRYFGNIVILCNDCHDKAERQVFPNRLAITQERIDKLKKRYEVI